MIAGNIIGYIIALYKNCTNHNIKNSKTLSNKNGDSNHQKVVKQSRSPCTEFLVNTYITSKAMIATHL